MMRPKADMNLTAMSDLTFLLLITFIITFPMIEQGVTVKLPKGKAPEIDQDRKSGVVTIDPEGRLSLGQDAVTFEELRAALASARAANEEYTLMIRGDEKAEYGAVAQVLRLAKELGIDRTAFVFGREDL